MVVRSPGRRREPPVLESVPASQAISRGLSTWGLLLGLGLQAEPASVQLSRTDWCLSLPGSSEIGLTSGITFPFLGNIFLETPTYPVTNWWVWRRGRFPKKGKEMSQMQAEVKWAQGSLTDKWA